MGNKALVMQLDIWMKYLSPRLPAGRSHLEGNVYTCQYVNDMLLFFGTFALGTGQCVLRNTGSIQWRQESTRSRSAEFFTGEKRGA